MSQMTIGNLIANFSTGYCPELVVIMAIFQPFSILIQFSFAIEWYV